MPSTLSTLSAEAKFEIEVIFEKGESVTMFGRFAHRSSVFREFYKSPFTVRAVVRDKLMVYILLIEAALGQGDVCEGKWYNVWGREREEVCNQSGVRVFEVGSLVQTGVVVVVKSSLGRLHAGSSTSLGYWSVAETSVTQK